MQRSLRGRPLNRSLGNKQEGFIASVGVLFLMVAVSYMLSQWLVIRSDEIARDGDKQQAQKIATYLHAVKNASTSSDSLADWNVSGAAFENGTVHSGTDWVKPTACGGTQSTEYLFCDFESQPSIGDDMQYRTAITNDGTTMNIEVEIANSSRTRGFDFGGEETTGRSCSIARMAAGGLTDASFDGSTSQVTCDTLNTGIITMQVRFGAADSDDINRRGLNEPLATIPWGGQDIENMNQLEVSQIVDREDNGYILDLDGNSIMNDVEIDEATISTADIDTANIDDADIDTATIDTGTVTSLFGNNLDYASGDIDSLTSNTANITGSITQTNSSAINSFAGSISSGSGTNTVSLENGSVYLSGSLVSEDDNSMFFNPNGISRTQDIRLTSRGGVLLSALLPNYVHKGAVTIIGQGTVDIPDCSDSDTSAARIVIDWQDAKIGIATGLQTVNDYAYKRIRVVKTTTQWGVQMLTYDYNSSDYTVNTTNRGLANVYCYYP